MLTIVLLRVALTLGTIVFLAGVIGLIVFSRYYQNRLWVSKTLVVMALPFFLINMGSILIIRARMAGYDFFEDTYVLTSSEGTFTLPTQELYGYRSGFSEYESIHFNCKSETVMIKRVIFLLSVDVETTYEVSIYSKNNPTERHTKIIDIQGRKIMNEIYVNVDVELTDQDQLVIEFKEMSGESYIDNLTLMHISYVRFSYQGQT
jgi:hypothetical protein